jgi:2-oxoglutarate ferredoxin oxidoreductase subunit gamma
MNEPSLAKFESRVAPNGVLLVNSCLVRSGSARRDLKIVPVAANDVAAASGNPRAANMVALGAYVGATGAASLETVETVVREMLAAKPQVVESNLEALRRGHALAIKALQQEAA